MKRYAPQLAKVLKGKPGRGSVFEPKLDGHRVIVHKEGDEVSIYSRTFKDQSGKLPHLEEAIRRIDFDFTLDGEVVVVSHYAKIAGQKVPVASWGDTQSVMGSSRSRRLKSRDEVTFVVFDCLSAQGIDLTDVVDVLRRGAAELIVKLIPGAVMVPRWKADSDYESIYEQVLEAGGEGLMVKNPLSIYHPGDRTNAWLKLKPKDTADVVIMGYNPGKDGFAGMVGSVVFGQYKSGILVERSSCSGMDLGMRQEFTKNGSAYIGKVMEITYNGRTGSDRSFRFPQFKAIRDDKLPKECTWDD